MWVLTLDVIYLFIFMEVGGFTMSCEFQVYSTVIQLYIYMYLFIFKYFSQLGYYGVFPCATQ